MANRNLDVKHEKILKALLRLPDNRKCAVCDTLGPQYVVIDFSTFVCANCCGVHRQFNHRTKGVSMATFKPEEIRALEEGGNGIALAKYLAKWNPRDAPKPTDRNTVKIRDWIDLVFVKRRFYTAEASHAASVSRTQSVGSARSTASRESDFGLRFAGKVAGNGVAAPQATAAGQVDAGRAASEAGSLIDMELGQAPGLQASAAGHILSSAPATPQAAQANAPVTTSNGSWKPFDEHSGGGVAGSTSGPANQEQGWAAFDALPQPTLDPGTAAAPVQAAPDPPPLAAAAPTAPSPGEGGVSGWQAFDSDAPLLPVPAATAVVPDARASPAAARGSLIMKELPSDLFSEPLPQPRGPPLHAPPGAGLPWGVPGAQGVPLHPGYQPHELVAYPVGPSGSLPQGYLQIDPRYLAAQGQQLAQQQHAMPSSGGPAPGVQPGAGIAPGGGMEGAGGAGPAEDDAFSGLVPGLRRSLLAAQPSHASVPQRQQAGQMWQQQPETAPPGFPWFNSGAQQQQAAGHQPGLPLPFDGGFGGPGLASAAPQPTGQGRAFQPAPAQRGGGNPFA